jgi:ribonuclease Z
MTWLVQPRLVNDPYFDPGLFVDFRFGRRALLFDLGDIVPLSSRELLRVSHVFVSHTHMDHFAGFDRLLRVCLHRTPPLHLFGPADFADRVQHKLQAYTWNLLDENSFDFVLTATEITGGGAHRRSEFRAREAFRRRDLSAGTRTAGRVLDEEAFYVDAAVLDHGTPCLAFAFKEKLRVNVWREGLDSLGLPVGPWLDQAKRAVRRGEPDEHRIAVPGAQSVTLEILKQHALRISPGYKFAYVVDTAFHDANVEKIVRLAQGADQLFIETAFLDEDSVLAAERHHLTAGQAGAIARMAGVSRIVPLHFSARYVGREAELREQAEAALRG